MTIRETQKIIAVITATFPGYYKSFTAEMLDSLVKSWFVLLKNYDYESASTGLERFLKSDKTGFPPSPGQIIAKMPSKYEGYLKEIMELEEHNRKRLSG